MPEYPTGTYVKSGIDGDIFRVTNAFISPHSAVRGYFGADLVSTNPLTEEEQRVQDKIFQLFGVTESYTMGVPVAIHTQADELTVISPEEAQAALAA